MLLYFTFAHDFINCMFATVTDVVKNFACGGLFSFLYFNFAHDFINCLLATVTDVVKKFRLRPVFLVLVCQFLSRLIHYLYANCENCCKKNFACGGLSSLLYFNFVYNFINYLCETV